MKKYLSSIVALLLMSSFSAHAETASSPYPVTIKSCEEDITFNAAPEKVVMLTETNASILYSLGVLDTVKFRAGAGSADAVFTADLKAAMSKIPEIQGKTNATGGVVLSTEALIETEADLVLGYDATVDRKALKKAGIQLYTPDAFCPKFSVKKASWGLADKEIDKMAKVFGVTEKGEQLKAKLQDDLKKLSTHDAKATTGVALYIGGQGEAVYAYGAPSMIQPIFEANNITNVYADSEERVFSVTVEDLLEKNPDWVVILVSDYAKSQEMGANKRLLQVQGTSGLQALEKNQVLFLPFNLIDPPSNLSVQGAITLQQLMQKQ